MEQNFGMTKRQKRRTAPLLPRVSRKNTEKKSLEKCQSRSNWSQHKQVEPSASFLVQPSSVRSFNSSVTEFLNPDLVQVAVGTPEVDNTGNKSICLSVESSGDNWHPGAGAAQILI